MKKLIGIVGSSMIGTDPFNDRCWSGSSKKFFTACDRAGLLQSAFGVEAPSLIRKILIGKNFSRNKTCWRKKFYMDPAYYRSLTKMIRNRLKNTTPIESVLQIGGIYDVPSVLPKNVPCYSYHDGNIAQLEQSPFGKRLVPDRIFMRARSWERKVYQKMTKVFTMSEYLRQSFIHDFHVNPESVVNIGVGINFDLPAPFEKDYTSQHILYIGTDYERKGLKYLVQAFDQCRLTYPNATLHIVGPKECPSFISNSSNPQINYHGFLNQQDDIDKGVFAELMKKSTLFVLPSTYEPLGIAVLEAMAYGMPVIVTNKWAFPEMVKENQTGMLVQSNDADDIENKLRFYLDASSVRQEHGNAAKQSVKKFDWDCVAQRLKEEIRDE